MSTAICLPIIARPTSCRSVHDIRLAASAAWIQPVGDGWIVVQAWSTVGEASMLVGIVTATLVDAVAVLANIAFCAGATQGQHVRSAVIVLHVSGEAASLTCRLGDGDGILLGTQP